MTDRVAPSAHLAKDSHTFGTQWFEVQTLNGTFAIAGDTVYWYSNVEQMWPPGYNQGNPFKTFCLLVSLVLFCISFPAFAMVNGVKKQLCVI